MAKHPAKAKYKAPATKIYADLLALLVLVTLALSFDHKTPEASKPPAADTGDW